MNIGTRESSDSIFVRKLGLQKFQYNTDDVHEDRQLRSWWYSDNSVESQAAFVFPIQEGEYSVQVTIEGLQSVDHIGGNYDGYWIGLIAYGNDVADNWGVGIYNRCTITDLVNTASWRPGHKDLQLNGCKFSDQIVERDAIMSFKVHAQKDASFYLVAPKTKKSDNYNFVVSYGEYTDKRMEFGTISVTIDERNDEARQQWHANQPFRPGLLEISHAAATPLPTFTPVPDANFERNEGTNPPIGNQVPQTAIPNLDLEDISHELTEQGKIQTPDRQEDLAQRIREYEEATSEVPDFTLTQDEYETPSISLAPPKPPGLPKPRSPPPVPYRPDPVTVPNYTSSKRSGSILNRFLSNNRSPTRDSDSIATTSRLTPEQSREYWRIRRSEGKYRAEQYKSSLGEQQL